MLVDVNVFIDVLEERKGVESSAQIMDLVQKRKLKGCISALTVPVLWFLIEKRLPGREAMRIVQEITDGFQVVPLSSAIIGTAFKSNMKDFEDAIQLHSAVKGKAGFLVTRNKKDFESYKGIYILTPEEFLERTRRD